MTGDRGAKMGAAAALAAGILLSLGTMEAARAADLGGNCCADLEERVAELEATTARKGNRKVSLTISGWVNQAVFFWDDGVERNAYVGTNSLEQDRVKFSGEAKIANGWTAGYTLEAGINGAASNRFSQTDPAGTPNNNFISVRKSSWFVKSKELGRLLVGQDGSATYHLLDDVDFTLSRNISDYEAAGTAIGLFRVRSNGAFVGTSTWSNYMGQFNNNSPGQSGRRNVVRYDTPTIANFTATAAWGEDDIWDVALAYKADVGDFKIAARVGYGESTDTNPTSGTGGCKAIAGKTSGECSWYGFGGTVQHTPTGLYVYAGYGVTEFDQVTAGLDGQSDTFYVQGGIERKWLPLGKTIAFGEYRRDDVGASRAANSSEIDIWALGLGQNIESADITFYGIYRHFDGEFNAGAGTRGLDDFDLLTTGAKINF